MRGQPVYHWARPTLSTAVIERTVWIRKAWLRSHITGHCTVAILCTWDASCTQNNPNCFRMGIFPQVAHTMACFIYESPHNTMRFPSMAHESLVAFPFKPQQRKSFLHTSCKQCLGVSTLLTANGGESLALPSK